MPKLNKQLLQSLVWDVEEILKVSNNITSWIDENELFSTFPLVTNKNIIDFVMEKTKTAGEQYICLWEIFHDKIRYYLCALVNYIEKIPGFESNSIMKPQKNLSLAGLVTILWTRIQKIHERLSIETVQTIKRNIWYKNGPLTKREYDLSSKCQRCDISKSSLRTFIETLNLHFDNYGIQTEDLSKIMKNFSKLWEESDYWTVVIQYIEALKNDLETMINNYNTIKAEFEILEAESTETKTTLNEKINDLSEHIERMQREIKRESVAIECLRTSKSGLELQLYQSEKKTNFMQEKIVNKQLQVENLDRKLKDFEKLIQENIDLKNSETSLKDLVDSFEEQKRVMEEKLSHLEYARQNAELNEKRMQTDFEEKRQVLMTQFRNSKALASTLQSEVSRLGNAYQQTQLELQSKTIRVQKMTKDNRRFEQKIDELSNKLLESERKITVLLKNPDINGVIIYEEVCDPAKDMQNQIEANKLRVRLLEQENHHLEGVIYKLKKKPSEEIRVSV